MTIAIANIIYGWPFEEDHQRILSDTLTEDDYESEGCLLWGPGQVNEGIFTTLYSAYGQYLPAYCGVFLRSVSTSGVTSPDEFSTTPVELVNLNNKLQTLVGGLPAEVVKTLEDYYGEPRLWVVWSTT